MENPQHVLLLWRDACEAARRERFALATIVPVKSFKRFDPLDAPSLTSEVLQSPPLLVLLPPDEGAPPNTPTAQEYERQIKLVIESKIARYHVPVYGYGFDRHTGSPIGPMFGRLKPMHYQGPGAPLNRMEFNRNKWFKSHNF